jgi:uncharacterized protein YcnI
MKKQISFLIPIVSLFVFVRPAFAHVVVKPNEVGVAAYQTFTVGVPNEKEVPVTGLKLSIPEGLKSVTPNVKPGWNIKVVITGEGENAKVTEINWTGGSIPSSQRDEFLFSAQVPASETTVSWKAYQTYKDGSVVSWDQAPVTNQTDDQKEEMEKKGLGPYSQTKIVNDLIVSPSPTAGSQLNDSRSIMFSLIAVALSVSALTMQLQSRRKK